MIIIPFPIKPFVRIICCDVTEARCVSAAGTAVTRNPKPVRTFFLEYVEHEGCACVFDGSSYDDALAAARTWAAEGIAVRDHTGECRGPA